MKERSAMTLTMFIMQEVIGLWIILPSISHWKVIRIHRPENPLLTRKPDCCRLEIWQHTELFFHYDQDRLECFLLELEIQNSNDELTSKIRKLTAQYSYYLLWIVASENVILYLWEILPTRLLQICRLVYGRSETEREDWVNNTLPLQNDAYLHSPTTFAPRHSSIELLLDAANQL